MRNTLPLILATSLLAAPLAAQEEPTDEDMMSVLPDSATHIDVEDWRAMAEGNSVRYFLGDTYIGREFFLRDGRTVRFELPNGQCFEGEWANQGTTYCFAWPGSLVCAQHMIDDEGTLWFPSVDANGAPSEEPLQSGEIVEGGFPCSAGLSS